MSAEPNPIDNGELFDAITLGGKRSPGKVTLQGHDRKVTWDVKSGNGQSGASTTLKEIPPIEFTASFYLTRDDAIGVDDIGDWPDFLVVVQSTILGGKPHPLEIYHPDLARNGITSVCVSSIGGTVHDGKGGETIAVKFQEYKPAKPAGGTANGSGKKQNPDPNDPDAAAKAQLAALTKQYQNTPWQ